jgi:hypothetical protein
MPLASSFKEFGYTIVELLIAGTLLALGIIAITSMMQVSTGLENNTLLRQQALIRLRSTMEDYRFYPEDAVTWNEAVPTFPGCTLQPASAEGNPVPCTISVSRILKNEVFYARNIEYYQFDVSISWTPPGDSPEVLVGSIYAPRPNI